MCTGAALQPVGLPTLKTATPLELAVPEKEEVVSYEMLQDILRSERRSNKIVVVPTRFWLLLRDFLATVTAQFRDEQAKDPFGRKVMMLTDEVKNARHAAESLWALRERKLAMLALAATKDRKRPEGITPEEAQLYAQLVESLESNRRAVFDGLLPVPPPPPAGGLPAPGANAAPAGTAPAPLQLPIEPPAPMPVLAAPHANAATQAQPEPALAARPASPAPFAQGPAVVPHDTQAAAKQELVTIRALGDIPPFVGPDMQTYLLKQGDIATVPPSIANLLVRRQKAAILDV